MNLYINNLTFSPIKGPSGNIEFLAFISKNNLKIIDNDFIKNTVLEAHKL